LNIIGTSIIQDTSWRLYDRI